MDNKTKKGQVDRDRVSGSEDYEVQYFKDKLGVSREEVLNAIRETGSNDREVLTKYLQDNKK